MARPIEWTEDLKQKAISEIIERISEGESVRSILNKDRENLPSNRLFLLWISEDELLSKQYARACEFRADYLFDEMFEIADDATNDFMKKKIGEGVEIEVLNQEHIQRSRIRIDTRKWALSKMNSKKYGDKIEVDSNNKQVIEYCNVSKQFPDKK